MAVIISRYLDGCSCRYVLQKLQIIYLFYTTFLSIGIMGSNCKDLEMYICIFASPGHEPVNHVLIGCICGPMILFNCPVQRCINNALSGWFSRLSLLQCSYSNFIYSYGFLLYLKHHVFSVPSPLIGGMRELGLMGCKSSIDIISDHLKTLKDFVKLAVGGGG